MILGRWLLLLEIDDSQVLHLILEVVETLECGFWLLLLLCHLICEHSKLVLLWWHLLDLLSDLWNNWRWRGYLQKLWSSNDVWVLFGFLDHAWHRLRLGGNYYILFALKSQLVVDRFLLSDSSVVCFGCALLFLCFIFSLEFSQFLFLKLQRILLSLA